MAFRPEARNALINYVETAIELDGAGKQTIREAVALTDVQRSAIAAALSTWWNRIYVCPVLIDVKPQHAFNSRIRKDRFPAEDLIDWLVLGCSDTAVVECDERGRPRLAVNDVVDEQNRNYDLFVPIRSDANGYVYIDDVIPKGLPGNIKARK